MATKGEIPRDPRTDPAETSPTPAAADVDAVTSDAVTDDEEGEAGIMDMPAMGEFSSESARQTPLDDLAEVEPSELPPD